MQDLLSQFHLSLDDLNAAERKTYFDWLEKLSKKELTLEAVKGHIPALVGAINAELAGMEPPPSLWSWLFRRRRETYLKARLKNLIMLQDFLTGPERARKWVESQLSNIKPTKIN